MLDEKLIELLPDSPKLTRMGPPSNDLLIIIFNSDRLHWYDELTIYIPNMEYADKLISIYKNCDNIDIYFLWHDDEEVELSIDGEVLDFKYDPNQMYKFIDIFDGRKKQIDKNGNFLEHLMKLIVDCAAPYPKNIIGMNRSYGHYIIPLGNLDGSMNRNMREYCLGTLRSQNQPCYTLDLYDKINKSMHGLFDFADKIVKLKQVKYPKLEYTYPVNYPCGLTPLQELMMVAIETNSRKFRPLSFKRGKSRMSTNIPELDLSTITIDDKLIQHLLSVPIFLIDSNNITLAFHEKRYTKPEISQLEIKLGDTKLCDKKVIYDIFNNISNWIRVDSHRQLYLDINTIAEFKNVDSGLIHKIQLKDRINTIKLIAIFNTIQLLQSLKQKLDKGITSDDFNKFPKISDTQGVMELHPIVNRKEGGIVFYDIKNVVGGGYCLIDLIMFKEPIEDFGFIKDDSIEIKVTLRYPSAEFDPGHKRATRNLIDFIKYVNRTYPHFTTISLNSYVSNGFSYVIECGGTVFNIRFYDDESYTKFGEFLNKLQWRYNFARGTIIQPNPKYKMEIGVGELQTALVQGYNSAPLKLINANLQKELDESREKERRIKHELDAVKQSYSDVDKCLPMINDYLVSIGRPLICNTPLSVTIGHMVDYIKHKDARRKQYEDFKQKLIHVGLYHYGHETLEMFLGRVIEHFRMLNNLKEDNKIWKIFIKHLNELGYEFKYTCSPESVIETITTLIDADKQNVNKFNKTTQQLAHCHEELKCEKRKSDYLQRIFEIIGDRLLDSNFISPPAHRHPDTVMKVICDFVDVIKENIEKARAIEKALDSFKSR